MRYSDSEILSGLKSGGSIIHRVLESLYSKNRNKVFRFVKQNSGNSEEAKDILQETITAFYINVIENKFLGNSPIDAYIFSIAKRRWLNVLKRKKTGSRIMDNLEIQEQSEDYLDSYFQKEKKEQMRDLFSKVGSRCQELLMLSFFYNYDNKELVKKLDYQNEQVVRNKKYKCLKSLKDLLKNKPSYIALLKG